MALSTFGSGGGCWDLPGRSAGIGCGGQTGLAGIVRECLKSGIHLFLNVIVHILQVADGQQERCACVAIVSLAVRNAHPHLAVTVRNIVEPGDDVPRREFAVLAVYPGRGEISRHHKQSLSGIERGGRRFGAAAPPPAEAPPRPVVRRPTAA